MFRLIAARIGLVAIVMGLAAGAGDAETPQKPTPESLLVKSDQFRQLYDQTSLKIRLVHFRNETEHSRSDYHLWLDGHENSLVAMLDPKTRGQKVLVRPEGMWLHMPNSRRALRITPMQRLMGDANFGDITQLRLAGRYAARFKPDGPSALPDGQEVWNLELSAMQKSATYPRIDLSVNKQSGRPVSASYYLQSGKLLKSVSYGPVVETNGMQAITRITFIDAIKANRKTVMTLRDIQKGAFRASDFSTKALRKWRP